MRIKTQALKDYGDSYPNRIAKMQKHDTDSSIQR